ncbi:hypothetical protein [Ornithinimicrobium kibberense]
MTVRPWPDRRDDVAGDRPQDLTTRGPAGRTRVIPSPKEQHTWP